MPQNGRNSRLPNSSCDMVESDDQIGSTRISDEEEMMIDFSLSLVSYLSYAQTHHLIKNLYVEYYLFAHCRLIFIYNCISSEMPIYLPLYLFGIVPMQFAIHPHCASASHCLHYMYMETHNRRLKIERDLYLYLYYSAKYVLVINVTT